MSSILFGNVNFTHARTHVIITRHRKSTLSKQGKTFLVNPRHIPGRLVQFYVLMSTFSQSILFSAFSIVAYFVDLAVNKIGIMCIVLFWGLKFFVCGSFYGLEKWHFKGNLIPPLFCKSPNLWVAFALSEEYWVLFNILQSSCQVSILRTYNVDKIIITNLPLTIKGVSHNFCCC